MSPYLLWLLRTRDSGRHRRFTLGNTDVERWGAAVGKLSTLRPAPTWFIYRPGHPR